MLRVRIISTGSEILQGLYPDTNAQKLSQLFFQQGFKVLSHSAAPDEPPLIRRAIQQALSDCDVVVMTGGLGPTADDINRDVVAELYDKKLVRDEIAIQMMEERFLSRDLPMAKGNEVQAMLPEGCLPLYNHWGTAPGFILPADSTRPAFIALPGPPSECCPMIEKAFGEELLRLYPDRPKRTTHTLHIAMIPESTINDRLADLFETEPGMELTILAKRGHVRIRIIASANTEDVAHQRTMALCGKILQRLDPELVFAEGGQEAENTSSAEALLALMKQRGETVATAESCTGGGIAQALTDVAGSSATFLGGWVTYSNERKVQDLGVEQELVDQHGAVSAPVVEAMAQGARERSGATYAVSVSGVAGPGGGSEDKPLGTVWFAVASPIGVESIRKRFNGSRSVVREYAVKQAIELVRRTVLAIKLSKELV